MRYEKLCNPAFTEFTTETISLWAEKLTGSPKKLTAKKVLNEFLQEKNTDSASGLTFKKLFILTWLAVHDVRLRQGTLQDALALLEDGLFEMQGGASFDNLLDKFAGVHPDVRLETSSKTLAQVKLAVLVKEEVLNYQNALNASLPYQSIFHKKYEVDDIWNSIREAVKRRVFEEFSNLFQSYQDPDLDSLVDSAYTDLSSQSSFRLGLNA